VKDHKMKLTETTGAIAVHTIHTMTAAVIELLFDLNKVVSATSSEPSVVFDLFLK